MVSLASNIASSVAEQFKSSARFRILRLLYWKQYGVKKYIKLDSCPNHFYMWSVFPTKTSISSFVGYVKRVTYSGIV